MDESLLWAIFLLLIGQAAATGLMWFRLGIVSKTVEKSCPFGKCPFYERAKAEAAPKREDAPLI